MGDWVSWGIGGAGVLLGWLLCQLIADLVGEIVWGITGPLRRPIWRVFVAATWPWPLLMMLGIGAAAVIVGIVILIDLTREHPLGLWFLLGGAGVMLVSPFVWRDARRESAGHRWRL
jgi:hypothetical protein